MHGIADTWSRLGHITRPVEIIGGDPATPHNDWISSAMPEPTARLPHGRLATVAGTGHMPMFEKPDQCAALVFARLGLILEACASRDEGMRKAQYTCCDPGPRNSTEAADFTAAGRQR